MNLISKLFRRKPAEQPVLSTPAEKEKIQEAMAAIQEPPKPPVKTQPRGRVIRQLRHPEFDPNPNRRGGRIVKAMPRELYKIKQAQEKFEDDGDRPKIEDISE